MSVCLYTSPMGAGGKGVCEYSKDHFKFREVLWSYILVYNTENWHIYLLFLLVFPKTNSNLDMFGDTVITDVKQF